jgi:thiamine-monophosphate kinase
MNMSEQKTELTKLGEFGLIEKLTQSIHHVQPSTIQGVGDDAAVISSSSQNEYLLLSTDTMVEGVHFDLSYVPLKHLGYKAVAVNVSDICAMNGYARQITVSLAVSNRFSVEAIEELYAGILAACQAYNVDLVGGDTCTSLTGLQITVTVTGVVHPDEVVYRRGASEHDLVVVSGDLGAAFLGLQVLEREKAIFLEHPAVQPDLDGHDYIIGRQLKPEARMDVVKMLKDLEVKPTSMIDVSDGLASEILHLCQHSNLGCQLYMDKIPIDSHTSLTAIDFNLDPVTCAMNGGEDYELLFTIQQKDYELVRSNPNFTVIGHMTATASGCYLVDKNDSMVPIQAQGWNHFKEQPNAK